MSEGAKEYNSGKLKDASELELLVAIKHLDNKMLHLKNFKDIAKKLADQIESLEDSVEHVKFMRSSDTLLFSPKIYLNLVTLENVIGCFAVVKGISAEKAILLAYSRKTLKLGRLKKMLTEKACVDIAYFDQLALTCYQYMLKNRDFFDISKLEYSLPQG